MTTYTAARACLLALLVIGAFGAIGTGTSLAYFSDSATVEGTFSETSDLCTESPESVDHAFNDSNANGCYDEGEDTYNHSELDDFDEPGANLVVPRGIQDDSGPIDNNGGISITAASITSGTDLTSKNNDISLTATDGGIDLGGTGIDVPEGNGGVDISATEAVNLTGASITTQSSASVTTDSMLVLDDVHIDGSTANEDIILTGRTVSAINADITAKTRNIQLSATANGGGKLDASQATLTVNSGNGGIFLDSNGDMLLDGATLTPAGNTEVDLGGPRTLFVDGTELDGGNGELLYEPSGVTVDPERSDVIENN